MTMMMMMMMMALLIVKTTTTTMMRTMVKMNGACNTALHLGFFLSRDGAWAWASMLPSYIRRCRVKPAFGRTPDAAVHVRLSAHAKTQAVQCRVALRTKLDPSGVERQQAYTSKNYSP